MLQKNVFRNFVIILSCTIFFCENVQGGKELPCRLVWVDVSTDGQLPSNLIAVHGDIQFAARVLNPETDTYVIGSYDAVENVGSFPFEDENSTASTPSNFQLLTNPYGCLLKWPQVDSKILPPFAVSTDEGYSTYVGRSIDEYIWIAGEADVTSGQITIVIEKETEIRTSFQVLTSFSKGVRLEVTQFQFVSDPFGDQLDYLGLDQIYNDGNVEIVQRMRHEKNVTETQYFKTEKTTTYSQTESSGWDIWIASKQTKVEHTYTETVTEEFTTIRETQILMEKEIVIPPFSSVTVCSTLSIKEDLEVQFTAKGTYKAAGMTADEVQRLLIDDQVIGTTIVGQDVVVPIAGTFKGSLAMNTQFIAVPGDQVEGCVVLQQQLFEANRERHLKLEKMAKSICNC